MRRDARLKSIKTPIETHGYRGFCIRDGKAIHIAEGVILYSYAPPPPVNIRENVNLAKEPYGQALLAIRLFALTTIVIKV